MRNIKIVLLFLHLIFFNCLWANQSDSTIIKVHFLYGSKPKKEYKNKESKWFGGILGGHVGIEVLHNRILNFLPIEKVKLFAKKKNISGRFRMSSPKVFWSILGGKPDQVKKMTIEIPISFRQKIKLDSISFQYLHNPPYDYAFIGMRCGSSTYDILAQIDLLKRYPRHKTCMKIFYPRRLRRRLIQKAKENNWRIIREKGSEKRKWEKD